MAFVTRSGHMVYWEQTGEGSPLLLIQGLGYPSDPIGVSFPRSPIATG